MHQLFFIVAYRVSGFQRSLRSHGRSSLPILVGRHPPSEILRRLQQQAMNFGGELVDLDKPLSEPTVLLSREYAAATRVDDPPKGSDGAALGNGRTFMTYGSNKKRDNELSRLAMRILRKRTRGGAAAAANIQGPFYEDDDDDNNGGSIAHNSGGMALGIGGAY